MKLVYKPQKGYVGSKFGCPVVPSSSRPNKNTPAKSDYNGEPFVTKGDGNGKRHFFAPPPPSPEAIEEALRILTENFWISRDEFMNYSEGEWKPKVVVTEMARKIQARWDAAERAVAKKMAEMKR